MDEREDCERGRFHFVLEEGREGVVQGQLSIWPVRLRISSLVCRWIPTVNTSFSLIMADWISDSNEALSLTLSQ